MLYELIEWCGAVGIERSRTPEDSLARAARETERVTEPRNHIMKFDVDVM